MNSNACLAHDLHTLLFINYFICIQVFYLYINYEIVVCTE